MDPTPFKLPIHNHPLFWTVRLTVAVCNGCHVGSFMYGAYICNEPFCDDNTYHKECAEAKKLEINHRSHPQHPLILTNDLRDGSCNFCGRKLLCPFYSCTTCEFNLDLACAIKPSPLTIEHPMCHEHPLVLFKNQDEVKLSCELCKDSIGGPLYACLGCYLCFHVDCVHLSKEVNHPCHSDHPLKLIASDTLIDDAEKFCLICERVPKGLLYHCSICNFTSCISCTKNPPPLVIEHTKTHQHPLTRFSKRISYTCDVCGLGRSASLYICVKCDFFVHMECIAFPHVININRHDHNISFTYHRATGYSRCGVCHQYISQYKGAYSCSVCPNYAVHYICAFRGWDGIEYEGKPDEMTEDIAPYKVVGDNLICHFSHDKHPLKFHKGVIIDHDEHKRCQACIHPLGFGSIYVCEECCFYLHEKCANLPMKKKTLFDFLKYTLEAVRGVSYCNFCRKISGGFKYTTQGRMDVDVHCGSVSEPFVHDGHIHHLYLKLGKGICNGCNNEVINGSALSCDNYDFCLCLYCASLPQKIWHKNDVHPLTLCFGEKTNSKYWCDICEGELDPSVWFYTCSDCGVTLHVNCVLGDFSRLMPGHIIYSKGLILEVILNNHNTRLVCSQCHSRCEVSVILKDCAKYNEYICSDSCLSSFLRVKNYVQ